MNIYKPTVDDLMPAYRAFRLFKNKPPEAEDYPYEVISMCTTTPSGTCGYDGEGEYVGTHDFVEGIFHRRTDNTYWRAIWFAHWREEDKQYSSEIEDQERRHKVSITQVVRKPRTVYNYVPIA